MEVYVVHQVGVENKIWDKAYMNVKDAIEAVRQYLSESELANNGDGVEEDADKIEEYDERDLSKELGANVASLYQGSNGHIYIRKVSVS